MRTRLIWKLVAVVTLGIAIVHAVYGTLRIEREVAQFEEEARRDHAAVAHALAVAATSTASRIGADEARQLLEDADLESDRAEIVWRSEAAGPSRRSAPSNDTVQSIITEESKQRTLVSTVSLALGEERGVLEIREPLVSEATYVQQTIARTAVMTIVLVLLCSAVLIAAGRVFVQQPIKALLAKLERVAQGDLSAPIVLHQKDELGTLAQAINTMCEQLAALQRKNEKETRAKIAALEQLRHADRLSTVGQLASGIAHELGTPLNVVAARAKMIARRKSTGEEAVDDAQVIVEQTERMTEIILQLLGFARTRKPKSSDESLTALCEQAIRILEPLARKNGVLLELAQTSYETTARIDAVQVQQVLANLVMNAIQAQPSGGVVRLQVSRCSEFPPAGSPGPCDEHAAIVVEDEGEGMSDSIKERLFEPFFTTKEVGQGTGLGLSVAYGIIHEHGGWIDVQTELGRGSRFTIHLPESTE